MNNPHFSIIIPAYNAEKTIERCIMSVQAQSFNNYEILIINDGSKDNTLSVIQNIASSDSRIKVFDKDNGGVSSARNLGIDNSQGEYILFIDADDEIEPNYLLSFTQDVNTEADLIIQGAILEKNGQQNICAPTSQLTLQNNAEKAKFIKEHLSNNFLSTICSKAFKRELLNCNKIRFNQDLHIGEDTIFVFNSIMHASIIEIQTTALYRYFLPTQPGKYNISVKELVIFFISLHSIYKSLDIDINNQADSVLRWHIFSKLYERIQQLEKKQAHKEIIAFFKYKYWRYTDRKTPTGRFKRCIEILRLW